MVQLKLLGNEEKGIEPGYFSNWIMKDPKTNQFNIWYADHWHHLCIRYAKATSSIAIVKVSLSLCFKRFGDNQINFAEKRCLYLSFENT